MTVLASPMTAAEWPETRASEAWPFPKPDAARFCDVSGALRWGWVGGVSLLDATSNCSEKP